MIATTEANERLVMPTGGPASDRQSWRAKPSLPSEFDSVLSKIRALAEGGLTSLYVLGDFLKRRIAPKPSLEAKRRSRLVLAAQSMTRGPRPACQGGRVTNKV